MPATVHIRNANSADLAPMTDLLKSLFSVEKDFSADGNRQMKGLRMLLGNPRARILVAEEQGGVVGMCTGQIVISTAEGGPSILVEDVVVRNDRQGEGIGTMLMEAILEFAEENRATRLQLLADCDNTPALKFYEKIGWSNTSLICLRKANA
ncbi:GNAT family N-acetyltransferase [Maridesulfovibrio salexigens]|uniref:GCN5-related N-acetyltransferase n=1 Tax=Maridesulfovibrio salexigens (strain ATCC 14822 / DSM 2638 / NCIMB 8403 / VKM B-1763) TaxID=526222 RepID=C6BX27_MARSD|nr:GNAT family N-acetyltransferase [Maridesulfovibrio salexigens]ACS78507.1 GCN5-related N-acetyltransferase [Maridesulfovibrio salexigens DSM 2638]